MTKLETTLICIIVFILIAVGFAFYFEHRGAKECKADDKTLVQQTQVKNVAAEATQAAQDKKAGDTLNATLSNPIGALPPVTSLQPAACPSTVSNTRSAPTKTITVIRTEPPPSVVQPDWNAFERSDVQDAHNADAQVDYLYSVLQNQYKLCGGK